MSKTSEIPKFTITEAILVELSALKKGNSNGFSIHDVTTLLRNNHSKMYEIVSTDDGLNYNFFGRLDIKHEVVKGVFEAVLPLLSLSIEDNGNYRVFRFINTPAFKDVSNEFADFKNSLNKDVAVIAKLVDNLSSKILGDSVDSCCGGCGCQSDYGSNDDSNDDSNGDSTSFATNLQGFSLGGALDFLEKVLGQPVDLSTSDCSKTEETKPKNVENSKSANSNSEVLDGVKKYIDRKKTKDGNFFASDTIRLNGRDIPLFSIRNLAKSIKRDCLDVLKELNKSGEFDFYRRNKSDLMDIYPEHVEGYPASKIFVSPK